MDYYDQIFLRHIATYDHGNGIQPSKLIELTKFGSKTVHNHLNNLVEVGLIYSEKIKGKKQGVLYKIRISHKIILNMQNTCDYIFKLFEFHLKEKKGNVKGSLISEFIQAISDFEEALLYLKLTHKDGDAMYSIGKNILDDILLDARKLIKKHTTKNEKNIAGQELKFIQNTNILNNNFATFFVKDKQNTKLDLIPMYIPGIPKINAQIPENNSENILKKERTEYLKGVNEFMKMLDIFKDAFVMVNGLDKTPPSMPKGLRFDDTLMNIRENLDTIFDNKGTDIFDPKTRDELSNEVLSSMPKEVIDELEKIMAPLVKIATEYTSSNSGTAEKFDKIRKDFVKALPREQQQLLKKHGTIFDKKFKKREIELDSQIHPVLNK